MRTALRMLVLVLAGTLVVTSLTQPAGAHYDPAVKKRVKLAGPSEAKVRQLSAENTRLKKALEAAKVRTREAREELSELQRKLANLRNAVLLREKLNDVVHKKREQSRHVSKTPEEPAPVKTPDRHECPEGTPNECAAEGSDAQEKPVCEPNSSNEVSQEHPGVLRRILRSESIKRVRKMIEGMVLRHFPGRPLSFTTQDKDTPGEAKKPAPRESGMKLVPLRERIDALKSRLRSATSSVPVSKKVESPKQRSKWLSAPRVPKKLRNELLKELREKFRGELGRKLEEMKREMRSGTRTKTRPSAWF